MALNEIKKQVVSMLQSVMTLDTFERSEALGFLKNCVSNFDLSVLEEEETINAINNPQLTEQVYEEPLPSDLNKDGVTPEAKEPSLNNNLVDEKIVQIQDEQLSPTDLSKTRRTDAVIPNKEPNLLTDINVNQGKKKRKHITKVSARTEKSGKTEKKVEKKKLNQRLKRLNDNKTDSQNDDEIVTSDFRCPGCSKVYETKELLFTHFKSHPKASMSCRKCRLYFSTVLHFWHHEKNGKCKGSQLQCTECGEKFKYRRHYLKHVLGHNDNNCKFCNEKFSTWVHYKNHLKKMHPDIKMERDLIPCKFCSMSFRRHLGLYNHYRVKHSKGKFVCLSCGLLLPTKEKYKEHVQIHESEKNWKCKICKMKFYRRQQFFFHVSVHKLGIYKCLTCQITVTSKADLSKHKKDGHEVKGLEPKFECQVCHKKFEKQVSLQNHSATHSEEKRYYCKYCVKNFSTLDSLLKHEKRKTHFEKAQVVIPESKYEKVYEDKLICESCGKQYKTQTELRWHLRVHKSTYECEECGKTFTLKMNLTKHMKLHRNPTRVVCELCGDTFNQLSALNEHHLMKHSDVRNAKCDVCGKAFKRKSELNRHMRIHEYKRSFVCFCGQAYKQSGHLRHHQRNVHGKVTDQPSHPTQPNLIDQYPNAQTEEIYNVEMLDRRKSMYVNGEHGTLLALDNLESEAEYRPATSYDALKLSDSKVAYVGNEYAHNGMEPMNVTYDEFNFGAPQPDKRESVFSSPAVDLSMVAISEVVHDGLTLPEPDRPLAPEPFIKMAEDTSHIQLLNLSEHIVQEYLLNLP